MHAYWEVGDVVVIVRAHAFRCPHARHSAVQEESVHLKLTGGAGGDVLACPTPLLPAGRAQHRLGVPQTSTPTQFLYPAPARILKVERLVLLRAGALQSRTANSWGLICNSSTALCRTSIAVLSHRCLKWRLVRSWFLRLFS